MTILQRAIITGIVVTVERSPPMAGQIRNAVPNAAPMNHIFRVRSAGVDISDIYAWITPNHAHPSPPTKRAKRKRRKTGVNP